MFENLADFLQIFQISLSLFALMTPPAVLSAFISSTRGLSRQDKKRIARKTSAAVLISALILYLLGSHIFAIFGLTLDAFRIGAGLLLMLSAIDLVRNNNTEINNQEDGDLSVVPLAIPMCMGPASIGMVMVMGSSAADIQTRIIGICAICIASAGILVVLLMADKMSRILKQNGLAIMAKLTGLLLAAIAAQSICNGLIGFLPKTITG